MKLALALGRPILLALDALDSRKPQERMRRFPLGDGRVGHRDQQSDGLALLRRPGFW